MLNDLAHFIEKILKKIKKIYPFEKRYSRKILKAKSPIFSWLTGYESFKILILSILAEHCRLVHSLIFKENT